MRRLLVVALLLGGASLDAGRLKPAPPAVTASSPAVPAPAWTYAASSAFELYTTANDATARNIVMDLGRVDLFLRHYLKLGESEGKPTRVIMFADPKGYAFYRPNATAPAFFQSGPDSEFIVGSLDARARLVIVHESVHRVLRRAGRAYPAWLNEGLAEFMSTIVPGTKFVEVGRPATYRLQALEDGKLLSVDRLLAVTPESSEYRSELAVFYAQSWALTHMLMVDRAYTDRAPALFERLAGGAASADALAAVYEKPVAAIASDLVRYIQRRSYQTLQAAAVPVPFSAIATRPAPAFETGVVLATLLGVQPGREADARAAFDALAKESPDSVPLLEARGLFNLRHDDAAGARRSLARAVELGSRDAHAIRALLRLVGDEDGAYQEALLKKAIALDPGYGRAHLDYARLLYNHDRFDEARAEVLSGLRGASTPDDRQYAANLAAALERAGHRVIETIASQPAASLLILNKDDATLAIVNPSTRSIIGKVPVGEGPHEVVVSIDGRLAFVANYGSQTPGNTISVVDLATRKELRRVDVSPLRRPHGLAFADGKLYFTSETNRVVGRYDPAADRVDWTIDTKQATTHMVMVNRDATRIVTVNISANNLSFFERRPGSAAWSEAVVPVGRGPEGVDITPDGKEVWAAHSQDGGVSIVDVATKRVTATIDIKTGRSNRLKFTPDGTLALVSDINAGEIVVIDVAARAVKTRIPVGRSPEGILMRPDGSVAYAAVTGDNVVAIIDLKTLKVIGQIAAGLGPDGMAWVGK